MFRVSTKKINNNAAEISKNQIADLYWLLKLKN